MTISEHLFTLLLHPHIHLVLLLLKLLFDALLHLLHLGLILGNELELDLFDVGLLILETALILFLSLLPGGIDKLLGESMHIGPFGCLGGQLI